MYKKVSFLKYVPNALYSFFIKLFRFLMTTNKNKFSIKNPHKNFSDYFKKPVGFIFVEISTSPYYLGIKNIYGTL